MPQISVGYGLHGFGNLEWLVGVCPALVSSADGAGMDHPSMEVEADGNHHGYDVGMECHRIKQNNVESTTS